MEPKDKLDYGCDRKDEASAKPNEKEPHFSFGHNCRWYYATDPAISRNSDATTTFVVAGHTTAPPLARYNKRLHD
jgi:hypothetical protein